MIGPEIPASLLAPSSSHEEDDGSDSEVGPAPIGPQIPPSVSAAKPTSTTPPLAEEEEDDEDDYAPALPPELAAARASTSKKVIGPAFPPSVAAPRYDDEDDEDDVGPRPLPAGYVMEEKDGVQEFLEREERRRKQLEEGSKPKALQREEWMLVPPSSSDLLGSIDPTKLTRPRQFARTAQPSRDADSSLWTETPAERQQRIADELAGKRRRAVDVDPAEDAAADARKRRKYEEEVRRGVEEHTKKARGPSLLKQHERVSAAKDAEKKRMGDEDEPPAFWDHGRDMAVGGKLLDDKTRNKFISEAKGLGDRFGSGKSGGFL
ncbi:hypothetical protein L226DRAFT_606824 [Lentinus tigrinus ALCF2SS1-7]|uniref:DUF3752 domain-containing protein n=1 Tax=Lentinus tigrinus ALCF2SS1-6 TaxID=1328759 RepID=A0A5C2S5L7_9APHY|nr:hypothetical protein L227DRAFT_654856 [Lentinus tigrinus ALCF2SS1-6]RPD81528.1 hypothetical protein L226DRAFT_606824 [Lentinus tigrinus ALCF2SS1-7]